jgi:UrcA family protein
MKTLILASTVALSLTTLAQAADLVASAQLVRYGDLDLSRTEGQAALYNRLVLASKMVCRAFDPSVSIQFSTDRQPFNACMHEAMGKAVANIHQPQFTAYVAIKQPGLSVVQIASR